MTTASQPHHGAAALGLGIVVVATFAGVATVGAGALSLAGCGHGASANGGATIASPADTPAPRPAAREDGMQVTGTLGTVSQDKVEDAIAAKRPEIDACYQRIVGDQPWLGGQLGVKVKVGAEGDVKEAWLSEALGNVDVERCVLGVVRGATFARPEGGQSAEFSWSIAFRGTMSTAAWTSEQVSSLFTTHRAALDRCALGRRLSPEAGLPRTLHVVLYVAPGGRVPSASAAADEALSDPYRDCVVTEVRKWKFPDPRGKVARAVYRF